MLEQLQDHGLLAQVQRTGTYFEARLQALAAAHPVIAEVRGAGLMRGLQLTGDAAPVVEGALARGLLVNRTAETVVRLLPPYTVSTEEIDEAVATLDIVLAGLPAEVKAK